MILTTNRVKDFDDAIQSRIHVGISYGNLGLDTRKTIWDKFLKKESVESGGMFYNTSELQDLAEHKLNGRQASCV
jgi:SpoVK/Ycf46/Vps4 family AAA+-type ATPase